MQELERALREFVAMPTVSCDPAHRDDCWRGAKFLGTLLESLGELFRGHVNERCQQSTAYEAVTRRQPVKLLRSLASQWPVNKPQVELLLDCISIIDNHI